MANKTDNTAEWTVKVVGGLKDVYEVASQSKAGLMSAADKAKLDGVAAQANKYVHPTSAGSKHIPAGGSSGQILKWSADGTAAWGATDASAQNFPVTASTQPVRDIMGYGASLGYDSTIGSGNIARYWYRNDVGVTAGTYTLYSLLQHLVNHSHRHYIARELYNCNCDCNCDCNCGDSDGGCIISGNILTKQGYKPIESLKAGDYIYYNLKLYPVVGVAKNVLGKRKAVSPRSNPNFVVTDEHLFHLGCVDTLTIVGAYDAYRYLDTKQSALEDGEVSGTYERERPSAVTLLSGDDFPYLVEREEYGQDTVTYTPIVDGCEWCIVDGYVIACARMLKDDKC